MIAEPDHGALTTPAPAELPAVTVRDEGRLCRMIEVRARLRTWRAHLLHPRTCRLVAAAIQHVLDARADGGMTVTIELTTADVAAATRPAGGVADALMLSADGRGVVMALLDEQGRPLTAVRLDQAAQDALTGDPS